MYLCFKPSWEEKRITPGWVRYRTSMSVARQSHDLNLIFMIMASKVQKKGRTDVVSQVDQVEGHLIRAPFLPSSSSYYAPSSWVPPTALELFNKKSRDSHEEECTDHPQIMYLQNNIITKQWKKEQANSCCTADVCLCQSVKQLYNDNKMTQIVLFSTAWWSLFNSTN